MILAAVLNEALQLSDHMGSNADDDDDDMVGLEAVLDEDHVELPQTTQILSLK